jgi:tetratricopeptide (TPR) repeat protein
MARILASLIVICLYSLSFGNEWHDEADRCWNEALKLKKERKFVEAIEFVKRAVTAEKRNEKPRYEELMNELKELGTLYETTGNFEKSLYYYQLSLKVSQENGQAEHEVMALINIGQSYYNMNRLDEAVDSYGESLKKSEQLKHQDKKVLIFNNLGNTYRAKRDFSLALDSYNKALEASKTDTSAVNIAVITSNIGTMHYFRGEYDSALKFYQKAWDIDKNHDAEEYTSIDLSNIAGTYAAMGRYTDAIASIKQALEIDRKFKNNANIAARMFRIGEIYFREGNYNNAIEAYTQSYEINAEINNLKDAASVQSSLGEVCEAMGKYEEALDHYVKALNMNRDLEVKENIAVRLSDIGMLYETRERHGEAVDYLSRALLSDMMTEKKNRIADNLSMIGRIMVSVKKYDKALEYFEKSLQLYRELNNGVSIGDVLKNIGIVYYNQKAYDRSIDVLWQGMRSLESVKHKSIPGIDDSKNDIYRWLVAAYVKAEMPGKAYEVSESCSLHTIYMKENAKTKISRVSVTNDSTRLTIKKKSALVIFSNMTWDNPVLIYIDAATSRGYELNKAAVVNEIYNKLGKNVEKFMGEKKTDIIFRIKQKSRNDYYYIEFEKIVNYYRNLLSKKYISNEEFEQEQYLSKMLYKFLFSGIESLIAGNEELIIHPEGPLATIPLETLIMPDGRFMVEKFNIKYSNSQAVLSSVRERKYTSSRKALLVVGNMNRSQFPPKKTIESLRQFELINENVGQRMSGNGSLLDLYGYFGIDEQLLAQAKDPDINQMRNVRIDADIVYGVMAAEPEIKKLSRTGQLSNYRVIHFSTKGIIVPEVSDIGSLVVSYRKNEIEGNEGLLNVNEIADMSLRADLVFVDTLCIPPVGYHRGEGIGTFCNAFLLAGAQSVAMSLWAVEDSARLVFMREVYHRSLDAGMPYDMALTATKRLFIKGLSASDDNSTLPAGSAEYKNPYFWGAFIYYGN